MAYLWDMLEAARTIVEFTHAITLEEYRANRMLQLAVERAVEIIGEAARGVSEAFRLAHPEIPWRQIIAQRNVVSHQYGQIDDARMWRLAIEDVPQFVDQLVPLVPSPPEDPEP